MGRAGWGAVTAVLVLLAAACSSTPLPDNKTRPTGDVPDAQSLAIAHTAADILSTFSVYDYALVGGLNGEKVRVVSADRRHILLRRPINQIFRKGRAVEEREGGRRS